MLSESERETLRDIERRLRWHSPELVRLFNSTWPQVETNRHQRARTRVLVAGAALVGLMLRGPRMLNEAEASAQQRPPLPRISRPATIVSPRAGSALDSAASVAAPVAVVDLSVDPLPTRVMATCRARARDIAVPPTAQSRTTGRLADRRAVSIGSSCPQSPSSTDRAESESSC
ncbi:MAG: DUF3040 domain-containing protein [Mycobacterium sp.]